MFDEVMEKEVGSMVFDGSIAMEDFKEASNLISHILSQNEKDKKTNEVIFRLLNNETTDLKNVDSSKNKPKTNISIKLSFSEKMRD